MESLSRYAKRMDPDISLKSTSKWATVAGYPLDLEGSQEASPALPIDPVTSRIKGYGVGGSRHRHRELLEQVKSPAQPTVGTAQGGGLPTDFTTGVTVQQGLKGDSNKKTCKVQIGGKSYVVKGGSGNVDDHVAATDFLRKLGAKGVSAPAVRNLSDVERTQIQSALKGQGADAAQLATALAPHKGEKEGSGLIAELTSGLALNRLFLDADTTKALQVESDLRQRVAGKPKQQAWDDVYATLLKDGFQDKARKFVGASRQADSADARRSALADLEGMKLTIPREVEILKVLREIQDPSLKKPRPQASGLKGDAGNGPAESDKRAQDAIALGDALREKIKAMTPAEAWREACGAFLRSANIPAWDGLADLESAGSDDERQAALDRLREPLAAPAKQGMLNVLSEVIQGTVAANQQKSQQEATARAHAAQALANFAGSDEGIEAFAGVAAGDLIAGMNDRLLGSRYNGGNFTFDPAKNELSCVDNSKEPAMGLNATDPAGWKQFVTDCVGSKNPKTLSEMLFDRIYGTQDEQNPSIPGNYVRFDDQRKVEAQAKVRQVLEDIVDKVVFDDGFGQPAKGRAEFLRARLMLERLFEIDATMATPPDLPEKIGTAEKMERMAVGLVASKKIREKTQEIKNNLRDGTYTDAQAKAALEKLQAQHKSLATDRRSKKIKFLIAATAFRKDLESRATQLNDMRRAAPAGVWSAELVKVLEAKPKAVVEAWRAKLAKDGKSLALLNASWQTFTDAVHQA